MSKSLAGAVLVVAAAFGLARTASLEAQPYRRSGDVGISVFQDENFRGRSASFRRDVPDLRKFGMNDRISSLRVAPGELWEICEHPNYEGRCQTFSGDERDLRRVGWQDRVTSLRRVGRRPGEGYPPDREGGLILYSDRFFRGDARPLRRAVEDMRRIGFDDRAESVRVGNEPWELCEHPNFRRCQLVDRDLENLDDLRLSRKITSARPARRVRRHRDR